MTTPFPHRVQDGAYVYTNQSEGTLEAFWGHECIPEHGQAVYALQYSGGFLR